jgi:hypothetical protein
MANFDSPKMQVKPSAISKAKRKIFQSDKKENENASVVREGNYSTNQNKSRKEENEHADQNSEVIQSLLERGQLIQNENDALHAQNKEMQKEVLQMKEKFSKLCQQMQTQQSVDKVKKKQKITKKLLNVNQRIHNKNVESESESEVEDKENKYVCQSRKEIKVDNYAGDSSVEAYIAQFKLIAQRNGWPRSEWANELALRLRGEARSLILPDDKSTVPSFKELCTKLVARFGLPKAPSLYVAQLRGRKRRDKETIPELQQWIANIGAKAYSDVDFVLRDRILMDPFISTLTDSEQVRYVLEAEPLTMTEAVNAAIRYEAVHKTREQLMKDKDVSRDEHDRKNDRRYTRKIAADCCSSNCNKEETERMMNMMTSFTTEMESLKKGVMTGMNDVADKLVRVLKDTEKNTMSESNGNVTVQRDKVFTCFQCGLAGHTAKQCNVAVKCFKCGKLGHWGKDCRSGQGLNSNGARRMQDGTFNKSGNAWGRGWFEGAAMTRQ